MPDFWDMLILFTVWPVPVLILTTLNIILSTRKDFRTGLVIPSMYIVVIALVFAQSFVLGNDHDRSIIYSSDPIFFYVYVLGALFIFESAVTFICRRIVKRKKLKYKSELSE